MVPADIKAAVPRIEATMPANVAWAVV